MEERNRLDALVGTGVPLDWPQVLVVDEKPVPARLGNSTRRRGQHGFSILVVAEVVRRGAKAETRLRLARAMPNSSTATWALVFAELGYRPDFVVADGAQEIAKGASKVFGAQTLVVPSLYHISAAITAALVKQHQLRDPDAPTLRLIRPVLNHLSVIATNSPAVRSQQAWSAWWDDLETLTTSHSVPLPVVSELRSFHEPRLSGLFGVFSAYPMVPASTGAVEAIISRAIEPMLARRRSGFRNIERTNRLFDLVVCAEHHLFDDLGEVMAILEADTEAHDGYTTALRTIEDIQAPGGLRRRYSSLRDPFAIETVARKKGVL